MEEKIMVIWDDVIPQEDLQMFAKVKMGSKAEYD
jgi:hypothetical protein